MREIYDAPHLEPYAVQFEDGEELVVATALDYLATKVKAMNKADDDTVGVVSDIGRLAGELRDGETELLAGSDELGFCGDALTLLVTSYENRLLGDSWDIDFEHLAGRFDTEEQFAAVVMAAAALRSSDHAEAILESGSLD